MERNREIEEKGNGVCENILDCECFDCFIDAIKSRPTADVQKVKHCKWKTATAYEMFGGDEECRYAHGDTIVSLYCSMCGFEPYASGALSLDYEAIEAISNYKFCPHCGARMDGEVE